MVMLHIVFFFVRFLISLPNYSFHNSPIPKNRPKPQNVILRNMTEQDVPGDRVRRARVLG